VTFGASIDQYAFGEKSSSYTARDFTVKACASLAKDVAVASVSVSACSSVSKEEINKVLFSVFLYTNLLMFLQSHLCPVYCCPVYCAIYILLQIWLLQVLTELVTAIQQLSKTL
jgi:hypothetical protein